LKKGKSQKYETKEEQSDENEIKKEPLDRSLFLFTKENKCRQITKSIQKHKLFKNGILTVITISSLMLAAETPLNDPNGTIFLILKTMDYVTTVIFLVEVVIKVIGSGFFFNGAKSYIRNPWNVVDFFIVIISLLDLFPTGLSLSVLKIVRMARLLRPLRVISKNESLKLSI